MIASPTSSDAELNWSRFEKSFIFIQVDLQSTRSLPIRKNYSREFNRKFFRNPFIERKQ